MGFMELYENIWRERGLSFSIRAYAIKDLFIPLALVGRNASAKCLT